jgi:hypothetical protein
MCHLIACLFVLVVACVVASDISTREDFFLFSVNRGEGKCSLQRPFRLIHDIFTGYTAQLLVMTRVFALMEHLLRLRNDTSPRLSLVLPPLCGRIVHGGDGTDTAYRWSDYLDVDSIRTHLTGLHRVVDAVDHGARVDVALHVQIVRKTDYKARHWELMAVCDESSREDAEFTHLCLPLQPATLTCVDSFLDADFVDAHTYIHGLYDQPAVSRDDCETSAGRSVAFLRAESITWGMVWFSDRLDRAMAALRPSAQLRSLADDALASLREGRDCASGVCLRQWSTGAAVSHCRSLALAVHWRRNNFAYVHTATSPSPATLAAQLATVALDAADECVLLLTDASSNDINALDRALAVRGWDSNRMVSLRDQRGHLRGMLPQAMLEIEKTIAIEAAARFLGTPPSSVSLWISRMRVLRGHAEASNGNLTPDSQ